MRREHALEGALPAGLHLQPLGQSRQGVDAARGEPVRDLALALAEGVLLQGVERGKPATRLLQGGTLVVQFRGEVGDALARVADAGLVLGDGGLGLALALLGLGHLRLQ